MIMFTLKHYFKLDHFLFMQKHYKLFSHKVILLQAGSENCYPFNLKKNSTHYQAGSKNIAMTISR